MSKRKEARSQFAQDRISAMRLFIVGLNDSEQQALQARILNSGADDDYVSSSGNMLSLAVVELARLRGKKRITVRVRKDRLIVSSKGKK